MAQGVNAPPLDDERPDPGAASRRILTRAYRLLEPHERRRGWIVTGILALSALFETVGVATVMPFLAVLADPGMIARNNLLQMLHQAAGAPEATAFLVMLGGLSVTFMVVGALVRTLAEYASNRFLQFRVHSFASRLMGVYLRQPYEFFLTRNTAQLQKAVLSQAEDLVVTVYAPILTVIAGGTVLAALVGLIVAVDPAVAAGTAVALGAVYAVIFLSVRVWLRRAGQTAVQADNARFTAANEVLSGIREIRLRGAEGHYLGRFVEPSFRRAEAQALAFTLGNVPKFSIEAAAFCGVIALALVVMLRGGGAGSAALGAVLPLIGLYAFAALRLLPAVQAVYRGLSAISYGTETLALVEADLALGRRCPALPQAAPPQVQPLTRALVLEAISYRYPGANRIGLEGIDLTIPAGSSLGVVGRTGAGKSTLVNVMLGLLQPASGRMLADDVPIGPVNLRAWQAAIGYVPQEIFLLDASLAENIALGVPPDRIDQAAVERAARMAMLHDVVASSLPQGYATPIGERGMRLSGGQRQRIGIARALYHDPSFLVFDEATSALDTRTEAEVLAAISGLAGRKTILTIAHRLTTVEPCDNIIVLDEGRIAAQGSYRELMKTSDAFRRIASAA